jgi:hypothetical protein
MFAVATSPFTPTNLQEDHSGIAIKAENISAQLVCAERSLQHINRKIVQLMKDHFPIYENLQNFVEETSQEFTQSAVGQELVNLRVHAARLEQRVANLQNRLY